MSDRLRWRIAYALDRLPWTCWANLVSWALERQSLRAIGQDWVPVYRRRVSVPPEVCTEGEAERDALRRENEALREALVEAVDALFAVGAWWQSSGDNAAYPSGRVVVALQIARAALAAGEATP